MTFEDIECKLGIPKPQGESKKMSSERQIEGAESPSQRRYQITAIGEVLWDIFPTGPRFGGAPANFSCTAAGLAGPRATVAMVSAVGNDELGTNAIASLQEQQVRTDAVALSRKPTGKVHISLDEQGVATYRFDDDCAWDHLRWSEDLQSLAEQTEAVCFGTLGQRSEVSRETIQRFVQTTATSSLRIFDVNLRPPYYTERIIGESLQLANVLKLNDEELPKLANLFQLTGSEDELLAGLAKSCDLRTVALTKGSQGAAILHDGQMSHCRGVNTEIVDTVGAGDAFTATMALGLLEGIPTDEMNRRACEVAAFVCSQSGATPKIPQDFADFLRLS